MDNNPQHIAVIIDGNRRYAKSKNILQLKGHEQGADKVEEFLNNCRELEIKETTIYALSTENLKRDKSEVEYLFDLFKKFFKKLINDKRIKEDQVKIRFIGDLSLVPSELKELAREIEEKTRNYNHYIINFCFAYGGRLELVNAFNRLLKTKNRNDSITEKDITENLWLPDEPELIIRTGGNLRTSNFLPWQSVYSEWIFLDKMWPEFTKKDLIQTIEKFKKIKRNFGK